MILTGSFSDERDHPFLGSFLRFESQLSGFHVDSISLLEENDIVALNGSQNLFHFLRDRNLTLPAHASSSYLSGCHENQM